VKVYRIFAAAILAIPAFFGSGAINSPAFGQNCTTKIGILLPISLDWGRPVAAAAQLAIDLVNEAGGVQGCQIESVIRDTQTDPKVGVDAARAMVDLERIQVLLGAVSSAVSMPILTSVTVPANVMQISCCTSSTAFTTLSEEGKTNGLWFRTFATSAVQAAVGSRLLKEGGFQNITIFYKNDDWGQDMGQLVASNLQRLGINVTASIAINDGQASYQAEVASALGDAPDAIYLALYPPEGIAVVRNWIAFGGTRHMVMANALKSDEFRDNVGFQYLADAMGTDTAPPRVSSADAFTELYRNRFASEPNSPGLSNSFDAAMIALLAMEAAGPGAKGPAIARAVSRVTDPDGTPITADIEGIQKAAEVFEAGGNIMYQGATGNVRFDENGDVSAAPAVAWVFTETGSEEIRYFSMEEVASFTAE
jgi:branched-chain amino acid transport system substrate-binding protein